MILACLISFFKCWRDRSSNATSLAVKSWLWSFYQSYFKEASKNFVQNQEWQKWVNGEKEDCVWISSLTWIRLLSDSTWVYRSSSQTTTERIEIVLAWSHLQMKTTHDGSPIPRVFNSQVKWGLKCFTSEFRCLSCQLKPFYFWNQCPKESDPA